MLLNGMTHPHTVTAWVHLAHHLGRAGQNLELAKRLCVEGIIACQLDPTIPRHVYRRALYTRAEILYGEKNRIGAARAYTDYLHHALQERNPPQVVVATVYFKLAEVDDFFGRAADAAAKSKLGAEFLERGRRDMSIEALGLRLGLADQTTPAEAVGLLKDILTDLAKVPGVQANPPLQQVWCTTEFKLAILESETTSSGALIARLKSSIAHGVAGYGEDDEQLLPIYMELAKLHLAKNQNQEGVACYRRVLAIRIQVLGPDHESVVTTQKILDELLADLKRSGDL